MKYNRNRLGQFAKKRNFKTVSQMRAETIKKAEKEKRETEGLLIMVRVWEIVLLIGAIYKYFIK